MAQYHAIEEVIRPMPPLMRPTMLPGARWASEEMVLKR